MSLSSISRNNHQCTLGFLCGSVLPTIKGYFALSLCWISFMNFFFSSAGKTPEKLLDRFYPSFLKKRLSSKLDTPNLLTSIIILNKFYLSPYPLINNPFVVLIWVFFWFFCCWSWKYLYRISLGPWTKPWLVANFLRLLFMAFLTYLLAFLNIFLDLALSVLFYYFCIV